jgi:alpha-ketoglutarate-dependent taurine dioxygenase
MGFTQQIMEEVSILETKHIEFTTIEEIEYNFDFYKKLFLEHSVIAFNNANLSHDQHLRLHSILKKKFNCIDIDAEYIENHSTTNKRESTGPDDVMLDWHVEHPYYKIPIVFSTWNMHKFKTDPENGKTYFVDMELLFKSFSEEDQDFLKKCIEKNQLSERDNVKNRHSIIGYHWINKNPVIRTAWLLDAKASPELETFDGNKPTSEQVDKYRSLILSIREKVSNDLDIRIVHRWQQGDLLLVDIYKMCHAVTGGFDPNDREFTGMWAYLDYPGNN